MDSRPLGKSVKGFPKKSLSCFQSGSKLGETSLSNCHLRCWRFFSSVSDKDPFIRLGSQNRKRSVFFLQNDFCQHHDKVQLYVIWCVVKINLRKLKCFNYFERSKLYDLLQQLFELQSSLCVLDKAQRIGCFFTVSPNFQYQNENWLVANQKHSFKKSSLLAQQVFSYWYWKLGGIVKNSLYVIPRRLLWISNSCCSIFI